MQDVHCESIHVKHPVPHRTHLPFFIKNPLSQLIHCVRSFELQLPLHEDRHLTHLPSLFNAYPFSHLLHTLDAPAHSTHPVGHSPVHNFVVVSKMKPLRQLVHYVVFVGEHVKHLPLHY